MNLTRAAIYAFLSRAFKSEVDKSFLEKVIAIEPTVKLLSESQEEEDLKEADRLLHEFAQQVKKRQDTEEHLIGDLAAEYASLFLGVSPNTVHLVESVYLGKDHLLYEKPYHEVLQAYRSLGFEKEEGFLEPEDHIAMEFEFMANLCRWEAKTIEMGDVENSTKYLNLQKEFLSEHLMKWVPELCHKLKGAAISTFYRAIAYLTSGFLILDHEMPDQLTEILKSTTTSTS